MNKRFDKIIRIRYHVYINYRRNIGSGRRILSLIKLRIKELAQEKGLKQYELAEKSGVTPQLLSRYWNNNMQRVSLEHLDLIARVLGVKPGELIVSEETDGDAA